MAEMQVELKLEESPPFEKVARHYGRLHHLPFGRLFVEHTLQKLLSENGIFGKRALDLGCGNGIYSRLMVMMGASQVTGVDNSAAMISAACQTEDRLHQTITYTRDDIGTMRFVVGGKQIVLMVFVVDQAKDVDELRNMCSAAYSRMAPGGVLIIITTMVPPTPKICVYDFQAHGLKINVTSVKNEHALIGEYSIYLRRGPEVTSTTVPMSIYSKETFKTVLEGIGFEGVAIRPLEVSPDCPAALGANFWSDLLESELFYSVVCSVAPGDEENLEGSPDEGTAHKSPSEESQWSGMESKVSSEETKWTCEDSKGCSEESKWSSEDSKLSNEDSKWSSEDAKWSSEEAEEVYGEEPEEYQ